MGAFFDHGQGTVDGLGSRSGGVRSGADIVAELCTLLIFAVQGAAFWIHKARASGLKLDSKTGRFINTSLFLATSGGILDEAVIIGQIRETIKVRDSWRGRALDCCGGGCGCGAPVLPDCANWAASTEDKIRQKAVEIGALFFRRDDLCTTILYGIGGIAGCAHQAAVCGHDDPETNDHVVNALVATVSGLSADELAAVLTKTDELAMQAMALLARADSLVSRNPGPAA